MRLCPFCKKIELHQFLVENDLAVAFFDGFPLSPGHALVIPRRHERDYFQLIEAEESAIWSTVRVVRAKLESSHTPQGYNIGVNVGGAGGQTVDHVHVHVIPRYVGDVDDPRGGIRWMIPAKARYWRD
jgi:diadenosine tetraphosphate (Ap4A) HIT family hydrolase